MASLARPAARNPLTPTDAGLVDAALASSAGQRLVDAMDAALLAGLVQQLDRCLAAAATGQRRIAPEAQIIIAMWINMSGPPTTLLRWLGGQSVKLTREVASPGAVVDAGAMRKYLAASAHFAAHPRHLARLLACAAVEISPAQPAAG